MAPTMQELLQVKNLRHLNPPEPTILSNVDLMWRAVLADPWDFAAWGAYCDALRETGEEYDIRAADKIQLRKVRISPTYSTGRTQSLCLCCRRDPAVAYLAIWCTMDWWLANGPARVSVDPIMWVRITDKRPEITRGYPSFIWWWGPESYDPYATESPDSTELPTVIFDEIEHNTKGGVLKGDMRIECKTLAIAKRSFEHACLRWAHAENAKRKDAQ